VILVGRHGLTERKNGSYNTKLQNRNAKLGQIAPVAPLPKQD
jgi:hypothetical protein